MDSATIAQNDEGCDLDVDSATSAQNDGVRNTPLYRVTLPPPSPDCPPDYVNCHRPTIILTNH